MASASAAADAVGEINLDWDEANGLDEILRNIADVVHALHERVQVLGEKVEETALRDSYGEAIKEAASSLTGIADHLHDTVGGGVLRR